MATLLDMASPAPQFRLSRAEPRHVYDAVRALRRAGHAVYRAGPHHHMVDDRRRPTELLLAMARRAESRRR